MSKENLPDEFIEPVDDGKPLGITDDDMFYLVMQDEASALQAQTNVGEAE